MFERADDFPEICSLPMNWTSIINELQFRTSRSSGAGGQHVNKTETRVEALLYVPASEGLSPEEKELVMEKLVNSISEEGLLSVSSQKTRSQFDNKEDAIGKLKAKLEKALTSRAKRVRTKPTKAAIETRLEEKKKRGEIKQARRKPPM
jgi:ribosome-associated protein